MSTIQLNERWNGTSPLNAACLTGLNTRGDGRVGYIRGVTDIVLATAEVERS